MADLVKKALDFLRAHPEFKPYKAGSLAPRDAIYNPKFFDLKKDDLVDEAGNIIASKNVTIPREGFSYDLPAQADPGKIFRGMSAEEFANFQKNSYLQSLGTHNIGEGQRGLTYFSVNPDEARSYAHSFAPSEFKPDPSRPAYVVAAKRPPDESIVHVPGTGESEVGVRGQIPRDDVTNVYRGNVVDYIEGVNEPGAKVSPQSSVHWEEINDYASGGKAVNKALKAVSELFDSPGMTQWREKSVIPASRVEDRYFTGTSKDKDFPSFNVGRHGAWFTKDPAEASSYAKENDSKGFKAEGWKMVPVNTADRVIPAYLRAENPFTGPRPESMLTMDNYKKAQSDWFDQLRAQGHDAWMPESAPDLAVILKDPSQIKSAISNSGDFDLNAPRTDRADGGHVDAALHMLRNHFTSGGTVEDALHAVRRHFDGEDGSYVDPEEPRPLTIYRGKVPVADEAGGSGREPTPAPPAFSYMPTPESVARQAARQPAYNPADHRWSDAGSTEGERLTRALGVEGELPKGETTMSAAPTGWDKYMPQRRPGSYMKRWGEAFNENADAVEEGLKAVRGGNYGSGALGMAGGALGMIMSPLTGMERVLVRDPILQYTGDLKKAQEAEMVADTALTGGVRGMVTPFAKAGSLERMATEPWNRVRMPSPGAAGAATAAGAMLAPEDAEASKLSKAMEVARMAIPRELSPLGFYSHGAEAARGLPQAKGTAQQFTSMLDKAGIRGPEMESYLQTFGGRPIVTREEIAKHFQDTMPKLTERVNYDEGVTGPDWTTTGGGTRFGEHALPGGENYREVRMMLPDNQKRDFGFEWFDPATQTSSKSTFATQAEAQAAAPEGAIVSQRQTAERNPNFTTSHWPGDPNVVAHLRMSDRTGPNGEKILHVEEIQSDWAQKARGLRDDEIMRVMKDKNLDWDEANKIVPSDFGFKKPADPMMEAKLGAAEDAYNEAANSHQELLKQINQSIEKMPDPRTMSPGDYNRAQQAHEAMRQNVMRANPDFEASANRVRQASQDLTSLREQQSLFDKSEGVPTGPYVTKTPQWTDLALKRALKEAAEGGYDRIVFTPGAEQAKRWDLQHHVNNITWSAEPDGTYWVGATGKDGKPIPGFENKPMTPRELRETFGSDIAKKIMKGEGKPMVGGPELELSGLDLQTGEGMRSYYDKIVPKRLQELIKKHDPEARVGAHEIPNTGEKRRRLSPDVGEIMNWHPSYTNLSRQEQSAQWNAMSPVNRRQLIKDYESAQSGDITGHGIDITPAMRESILRGQSAHARGGEVMKGEEMRDHYEGGGLTGAALKLVRKAVQKPPAKVGIFPQVAERYPEMVPPVPAIDKKTGKEFLAKTLSPEAVAVQKARIAAQKEINAGNYEPYFPLHERFDVDPSHYPEIQPNTRELVQMKSPKAVASYEEKARDPQAMENLKVGFEHGMKQKEMAENWYFMGQLEREFINEYGPELGRKMFKEKFPDAMAATTGGADPTSNLMMAHFGNYLHARGEPMPTKAYEYPFPVAGGKYGIQNNMDQYRKMIMEGEGLTYENPKRYNFSGNFLGKKTPTIDEQMSGAWDSKMSMPPTGSYGHYEGALSDLAGSMGYDPRYFQEVGWAGIKDMKTPGGFKAQPMIGIVNEAIERTHRITGMPKDEIVRRGLVRSEIPLYGAAGATAAGAVAPELMRGEEQPSVAEERRHGGAIEDHALAAIHRHFDR